MLKHTNKTYNTETGNWKKQNQHNKTKPQNKHTPQKPYHFVQWETNPNTFSSWSKSSNKWLFCKIQHYSLQLIQHITWEIEQVCDTPVKTNIKYIPYAVIITKPIWNRTLLQIICPHYLEQSLTIGISYWLNTGISYWLKFRKNEKKYRNTLAFRGKESN